MNQIVKRFAKGVAWSVIVLAGSGIVATPDASAHGVRDSRFVVNVEYRNRHAVGHMPRWLRRNYNFRRWYVHQQHRLPRRASWGRVYELYLYDTRRFRRAWHRRFDHGHDWRDQPRRRDRGDNRRRRG